MDITKSWKIFVGDNPAFAQPTFDDKDWKPVSVLTDWEEQGYTDMDGVAWYRVKFGMPAMLPSCNPYLKGVVISLGKIDDNECNLSQWSSNWCHRSMERRSCIGNVTTDLASFISFASPVAAPKSFASINGVVKKTVIINAGNASFTNINLTI